MNTLKTFNVTVTCIDNSKKYMVMQGTSRKNIFKQIAEKVREGEAWRNPIVVECN